MWQLLGCRSFTITTALQGVLLHCSFMFNLKIRTMQKLISWVEIPAVDFGRAVGFYSTVLAVTLHVVDGDEEKMACFPSGEGAISFAPNFKPSNDGVLVSLNTGNDLDGTISRIEQNGGKIIQPKIKIQTENRGYFSLFIDCEGNRMGLYGDC